MCVCMRCVYVGGGRCMVGMFSGSRCVCARRDLCFRVFVVFCLQRFPSLASPVVALAPMVRDRALACSATAVMNSCLYFSLGTQWGRWGTGGRTRLPTLPARVVPCQRSTLPPCCVQTVTHPPSAWLAVMLAGASLGTCPPFRQLPNMCIVHD